MKAFLECHRGDCVDHHDRERCSGQRRGEAEREQHAATRFGQPGRDRISTAER